MATIDTLKNIIEDLQHAKEVSKEDLLIQLITERLDTCLDAYIENLRKDVEYLEARKHLKLIRKISK